MPAVSASAPAKIILFGEHAVVYGRPAIAVPVRQLEARAVASADIRAPAGRVSIDAPGIGLHSELSELDPSHPLAIAIQGVLDHFQVERPPALKLRITSTIPPASGLGSGAAVSIAVMRVLSAFIGHPLTDQEINRLAFEVEKIHHGTPSGIDNTVITYAKPVYYLKGQPIETLKVPIPFTLIIGDTGIQSPTAQMVGRVGKAWESDRQSLESIFDKITRITRAARQRIENGTPLALGELMDENHACLQDLGVSSTELDHLVETARQAGARGAKLSGGGGGGNMIALGTPETADAIAAALLSAGAARTIITHVQSPRY